MDIVIRRGPRGTVLLGERPAAPAGTGRVQLSGADAYLDPTAPDTPPHTLVHDVEAAAAAVAAVHGAQVAETLLRFDAPTLGPDRPAPVVVTDAVPGSGAAACRAMALADWLGVHSPDGISAVLLDTEAAVAAADLEGLLDDAEAEAAADRLRGRAGVLLEIADRARIGTGPADPVVGAGIRLLHELLGPGDLLFDRIRAEATAPPPGRPLGGPAADRAVTRRIEDETADTVGAGRDIGAPDGPRIESVDWLRVPRGLLGTGEDTVRWRLLDDAARVEVSVAAVGDDPATGRLGFRLYSSESVLPIALGLLTRSADGSAFDGGARVGAPASGRLTLDVFDARQPLPPRLGVDRDAARATRWAVRGVTALRLAGTIGDRAAIAALDAAGLIFDEVARRDPSPAGRVGARRREARCRSVEDAARARSGRPQPFGAGPDDPGPDDAAVRPADTAPVDLDAPGWAPLAAERALWGG